MSVPGKALPDYTLPSVVPDVARVGIDHGEKGADAPPVFLPGRSGVQWDAAAERPSAC